MLQSSHGLSCPCVRHLFIQSSQHEHCLPGKLPHTNAALLAAAPICRMQQH